MGRRRAEEIVDGKVRCKSCGEWKPLSINCKNCANTRGQVWQKENKERACETDRQYYLKHRESLLKAATKYRENHGDEIQAKARQRILNAKLEIIIAYGGCCACCGESRFEFLSIDHVNNDGCLERKEARAHSLTLYRKLKKLGFPQDRYQLLCFNCNLAKGFYGVCPHEIKRGQHKQKED